MNRRIFLRQGSLTGLSLSVLSLAACSAPADQTPAAAGAAEVASGDASATPETADFALLELTLAELQDKMTRGEMTSRDITELYLNRIEALNRQGPKLNAVLLTNPEALDLAAALDQERKEGKIRGPLHGIPILLKDNIDTADQQPTTAGSLALAGHRAKQDAFIVEKLRAAGAVVLGKTNLSEWANFRSTRSTSGWSSVGGQTKNPYILDRTPSGSSAGSGAAAAASFCAAAIGTETDGSIVSPASCSGLVGVKPTVGLWSRAGIIPISATQDTAGPMTRTVHDAALLLGPLAGPDPRDPATKAGTGKAAPDYTTFLKSDALKGQRLGVEKGHLTGSSEAVPLLLAALEVLKAQGATIVEVEVEKLTDPLGQAEYDVLLYEFKDGVNQYLATAGAQVKTLADVIKFNTENKGKAMPFFQQEILEASEKLGDLKTPAYQTALKKSQGGARAALDGVLSKNRLAAIVAITNAPARCIDLINGDSGGGPGFSSPAAMAGYPHVTVPMGQAHGLPVGLSFVGAPWQEGPLLGLAYAYEQASKKRAAPQFKGPFVG
ncbi:amidase [Hymenobacter lapidiphilus]|uniref:Amidase n=1 Tax=Hymenobacter lapidiphilus TaxID=2608003 RepID=A0A7Y7U7F5_9BACT|nr:amidase [Hymenobacter lapidiphilus]NVO32789.1 amidase [Hymenobacter lapidiphilus]